MTEKEKKVLIFPRTIQTLTNKGMEALNDNKAKEALYLFQQALNIAPSYYQARLGEAVAYMKMEKYREALTSTEKLLHEGLGDFYEVLQIHIILLLNMGNYSEIKAILEGILSEGSFPAKYAESFFNILDFVRNCSPNHSLEDETRLEELFFQLKSRNKQKQWLAIQQLVNEKHDRVINEFQHFLKEESNDLMFKTVVLQALQERNVDVPVTITKMGKSMDVVPNQLEDPFGNDFAQSVEKILVEQLEDHNPTLKKATTHIWWNYFFALYPFDPMPKEKNIWSATSQFVALESYGIDFDETELANQYGISVSTLLDKADEMFEIYLEIYEQIEI